MIEAISNNNINEILPLIRAYQTFYKVQDISDAKNAQFFSQFGESSALGCQFIYREGQQAVAFTTVYFSYTSTIAAKVAVLNDVYTLPEHRGKGFAKKLIEHCKGYAKQHGAARLQWVTAPDNEVAQRLYDAMDVNKSTWHFYTANV